MSTDPAYLYLSQEVSALQYPDGGFLLSRLDLTGSPVEYLHGIDPRARRCSRTRAWAIMLELSTEQRTALDLPSCDALTGGTALCLTRSDKAATGEVPTPRAPRSWDELAAAETWPLAWIGAHSGEVVRVVLPDEQ